MSRAIQITVLTCLGLTLAIFVCYREVAGHRFVEFDDGIYTFQNTYIIRGLCWDSVCWAFTNFDAANWHPLTWISHLVDRELFGSSPGGYLLMNVFWHITASCACFVAFFKLTNSYSTALVVTIFFALHPANVENVAWTSERKSLLNAFFWFLAIWTYLRFKRTREFRDYGIVIIAHLLGLMCKAMSVTLPCTLILLELLQAQYREPGRSLHLDELRNLVRRAIWQTLPLSLISIYFCVITASAQRIAMSSLEVLPVMSRIVNALQSYERYLAMIFHPTRFAIFYPLFNSDINIVDGLIPSVLLIIITLGVFFLARYRIDFVVGWLWFLGTMIPVIGIVQVGSQSHADRYVYIPILGVALWIPALIELIKSISQPARLYVGLGFSAVAGLSLGLATYFQVRVWENGITLFRHSLAITGDCMTSVGSLTSSYLRQDRGEEAFQFISSKIALSKNPENKAKLIALKAHILLSQGKYRESLAAANESIELGSRTSQILWLASQCNFELGNLSQAKAFLKEAEQVGPIMRDTFLSDIGLRVMMHQLRRKLDDMNVTTIDAYIKK